MVGAGVASCSIFGLVKENVMRAKRVELYRMINGGAKFTSCVGASEGNLPRCSTFSDCQAKRFGACRLRKGLPDHKIFGYAD